MSTINLKLNVLWVFLDRPTFDGLSVPSTCESGSLLERREGARRTKDVVSGPESESAQPWAGEWLVPSGPSPFSQISELLTNVWKPVCCYRLIPSRTMAWMARVADPGDQAFIRSGSVSGTDRS